MDHITAKEAAEKWGVTIRHVQNLCNQEKIKGAYRFGKSWMIPARAVLPSSAKKNEAPHLPMPRQCPFLDMTNLYNKVGGADECAEMLVNNPEAYALFKAQIAYRRGDVAQVYKHARYFLDSHSGFNAIQQAYFANSALSLFVSDGDGNGLDADFVVTSFSRSEPLEEALKVSVTCKPTLVSRAPSWVSGRGA